MSKGHSCRKGRSRCTAKIGPHARAHKKRSVVREQAERQGQGGRSQSDPMFVPSSPTEGGECREVPRRH
jgi:hypothetical protein